METRTLTVKNLPSRLHQRLKARASRHRRSLNSEVIACLEEAVCAHPTQPHSVLARAKALRPRVHGIDHEEIDAMKREGRP